MDNKLTAVDWLFKKITQNGEIRWRGTQYRELFAQAKAMEKNQIKRAYMICDDSGTLEESKVYAEKYYNRTYGQ